MARRVLFLVLAAGMLAGCQGSVVGPEGALSGSKVDVRTAGVGADNGSVAERVRTAGSPARSGVGADNGS